MIGIVLALLVAFLDHQQKPRYLAALVVSSSAERSTALTCPAGHERISDQNFNEGAGGEYIFICAKYTADAAMALTDVHVHDGVNGQCAPGLTRLPQNLNQGTSGRTLFLCWGKRAQPRARRILLLDAHPFARPPVPGVDVICWDSTLYDAVLSDADQQPADLNRGAGGKYIYLCVRRIGEREGL